MTDKIERYKLSRNLGDGDHDYVVNHKSEVLAAVQSWHDAEDENYKTPFTIGIVKMTDEEFNSLPEGG